MKNKTWLVCILFLAGINIYLFWPGNLYFLNDDLLHIPLTDRGQFFQTNSVRPIHELLVKLDLVLWGKKAYGYHIAALLFHFVVCVQLYNLSLVFNKRCLKMANEQALQTSLLTVVFFLAYPQSSESLGWILGRAPILSAVFILITIRLFFSEDYKWSTYLIGAFFFSASLFTYEQTLLVPIVLLALVILLEQIERPKQMFAYAVILLMVGIGYIVIRKLVTSEVVGTYEGSNLLAMNVRNLTANTFRILFRLILNPASKYLFLLQAFVLLLIIACIIFYTRGTFFQRKPAVIFAGFILLLIAPIISLGVAVNSFESGRYLYLPSIFLVAGISTIIVDFWYKNSRLKNLVLILSILLIAYWLVGKMKASTHYADASSYSKSVEQKVQQHFITSSDTLFIDTLRITVHRLPVFRRGFKTGINWFNSKIDTNKVVVRHFEDEVLNQKVK